MDDVVVVAKVTGDVSDLLRALDKGARGAEDFERDMRQAAGGADSAVSKSSDGIIGSLKKIAGIALVAEGAKQLWDFGKAAINAASDLNEAGTAVEAVFGTSFGAIETWAQGAATAMGQSTLEALNAAKTFGVFGSAANLSAAENAKFAMSLTETASDLASFHNADPSEVIEAIGAGLRGEAEPLRRFGILMDDASLKAAAMAKGIYDGTGALTQEQKILAAHALIMDQVGAAAGDFEKTQYGLANQQRIMSAQWTDVSAKLGTAFLPMLQTAALVINTTLLPALGKAADWVNSKFGPAFEGLGERVGPALASIGDKVGPIFDKIWSSIEPFISQITVHLLPALATLGPPLLELVMAFSPFGLVLKALTPVIGMIVPMVAMLAEMLGGLLAGAVPVVTELLNGLATIMSGLLAAVIPVIGELLMMLMGVLEQIMPVILEVAASVGDVLLGVLSALMPVLPPLLDAFMAILGALLPLIEPILQIVMALLPLVEVVGTLIGALLPPLVQLFTALLTPILALLEPLIGLLVPVLGWIAEGLELVIGWVAQAIDWFVDWASNSEDVGSTVSGIFEWIGDTVDNVAKGIGAVIGWIANFIGNAFRGVMHIVQQVGNVFRSVFGAVGGFISNAFNSAIGVVKGAVNGIIGLVNRVIGALNGIRVNIPSWVPFVGGQTFGINLPRLPYLADGGTAISAGMAVVGEEGPELIRMPRGASVIPLGAGFDASDIGEGSRSGGGSGGGGDTIINVTVEAETPRDREFAHELAAEIRFQVGD